MLCIALVVSLCATPASAQSAVHQTISIRLRDSYPICAGYCPNFEMTVTPSGQVTWHSLWAGRSVRRYTVSPAEVEAFGHILDSIKPEGDRQLDGSCERGRKSDGTPDPLDHPRTDDLEIRWSSPNAHARLTGCYLTHRPVIQTIQSAMKTLGFDLIGRRIASSE